MLAARFGVLNFLIWLFASCGQHPVYAADLKKETGDSDAGPTKAAPVVQVVTAPTPKPAASSLPAALIKIFQGYVGIHEQPMGSNNGPMVNKFNQSCGLDPSEHAPWCASCAHYGYAQVGLHAPGAYSPDWFSKSRRIDQQSVQPAEVALVYFPSKGRYAHTIACVEKIIFSAGRVVQVQTLEGNTNAQGSREGDQFARRNRPADTLTFVRWWNQP